MLAQRYLENCDLGQKDWKEMLGEGKLTPMVWMVQSWMRQLWIDERAI